MTDQPPWDHQSPWDAFGRQNPRQGQGQSQHSSHQQYGQQDPNQYQPTYPPPPQPPYGQQSFTPGQPPYGQGPQAPYTGQQPGYVPQPGRRAKDPWPVRHKVLTGILAAVALIFAASIGAAAAGGSKSAGNGSAAPAPTVTVTSTAAAAVAKPGPTVTVTKTVQATANAQGEATQISADGVYVVGQDIPDGTWHTSGGAQCYEATLGSTDTSNIIDNNNFTGPDTVSLAGAKAFNISGGCTWRQEG